MFNVNDFANKLDPNVWAVLNNIRVQPTYYVPDLEEQLKGFTNPDRPLWYYKDTYTILATNEGTPAIQEAIDFLKAQESLPVFGWNDELYQAAIAHS